MDNKIEFITEDNEKVLLSVIEEFKLNGSDYLLVEDTDAGEDEDNAYILKVTSNDGDDVVYEMVEDETELDIVSDYLNDILDDILVE